jgi:hypothetical protein
VWKFRLAYFFLNNSARMRLTNPVGAGYLGAGVKSGGGAYVGDGAAGAPYVGGGAYAGGAAVGVPYGGGGAYAGGGAVGAPYAGGGACCGCAG